MFNVVITERTFHYHVDENNNILPWPTFPDGKPSKPSGDWKLLGFCRRLPFGQLGPLIPPEEMLGKEMRFANGRGAYVAVDLDHGTYRIFCDRVKGYVPCHYPVSV